jgi:hypothetical protein
MSSDDTQSDLEQWSINLTHVVTLVNLINRRFRRAKTHNTEQLEMIDEITTFLDKTAGSTIDLMTKIKKLK